MQDFSDGVSLTNHNNPLTFIFYAKACDGHLPHFSRLNICCTCTNACSEGGGRVAPQDEIPII